MAVWKEVEAKGVTWLVSDEGEVKRPAHKSTFTRVLRGKTGVTTNTRPEELASPHVDTCTGRLYVRVSQSKERTSVFVHKLVAAAFLPPRPKRARMRWIDGDKWNNRATNLEWFVRPVKTHWLRKPKVQAPPDYAGIEVQFTRDLPEETRAAVMRSIARALKAASPRQR